MNLNSTVSKRADHLKYCMFLKVLLATQWLDKGKSSSCVTLVKQKFRSSELSSWLASLCALTWLTARHDHLDQIKTRLSLKHCIYELLMLNLLLKH